MQFYEWKQMSAYVLLRRVEYGIHSQHDKRGTNSASYEHHNKIILLM